LITPAVGGGMWAITAGLIWYSSRKLKDELDGSKIPLMGVIGAFVFAAQMINFTIPATGSSGHLGGGMMLAILLGPYAAFLTLASVLTIQAFFFADGGLLALGCNIFNLGFFPCFIGFPFIYKKIVSNHPAKPLIITGAMIAAIVSLQLGAFSVVLQTWFSGISELPFDVFAMLMQPIHLAIGIVEGVATAAVVLFIWKARPEILRESLHPEDNDKKSFKKILIAFLTATILIGGALSWFASSHPDGLEWSMFKTSGSEELESPETGVYHALAGVQKKTAFLPGYGFKSTETPAEESSEKWPAVDAGTSISGMVGSILTLLLAVLLGFAFRRKKPKN